MAEELQKIDPDKALEKLTADERIAYERHIRANKPGLAPSFNQRLYELYLRGMTCEAISLLNPGLSLADVVRARIDGSWDEKKDVYLSELLDDTNSLIRQTAAESLQFLSLALAVANREHGEAFKRYLATGDPKELGDFRIVNFKGYQTVIETIAKLIGADTKKTVTHTLEVSPQSSPKNATGPNQSISSDDAGAMLKAFALKGS